MVGLKPLKMIKCYTCNKVNDHYTRNCPNNFCKVCKNFGHLTNNFNAVIVCQYCNGNHYSRKYSSAKGLIFRKKLNSRCLYCNRFGYMMSDYNKINNNKNNNNRNNYYYKKNNYIITIRYHSNYEKLLMLIKN